MTEPALQDSEINKQSAELCGSLAAKLGVGQPAGSSGSPQSGAGAADSGTQNTPCSKKTVPDIAAMTAAEIEEELKKKNAILAALAIYAEKCPFTKEDCDYIRNTYGLPPICIIPLAPNDIPIGTPIAATYCDEISEEEKALAQRVIAQHFPQARITLLKEKGTNRDVWAIVGLDAKLASGVLIMEQERLAAQERKKALEEELRKRETDEAKTGDCFAGKVQKEKSAGINVPPAPARFADRVAASEEHAASSGHTPQ